MVDGHVTNCNVRPKIIGYVDVIGQDLTVIGITTFLGNAHTCADFVKAEAQAQARGEINSFLTSRQTDHLHQDHLLHPMDVATQGNEQVLRNARIMETMVKIFLHVALKEDNSAATNASDFSMLSRRCVL